MMPYIPQLFSGFTITFALGLTIAISNINPASVAITTSKPCWEEFKPIKPNMTTTKIVARIGEKSTRKLLSSEVEFFPVFRFFSFLVLEVFLRAIKYPMEIMIITTGIWRRIMSGNATPVSNAVIIKTGLMG